MNSLQNVTVSENAITFKKTSINKRDIQSIEYAKPKSIIWAIVSNLLKYLVLIVFVVGIPICIYVIYKEVSNHRVIITLKEYDKKGKRKTETLFTTKEESDFIRENY